MNSKLNDLRQRVHSVDADMRGRAMQELLLWARKDAAVQPAALEIFRQSVVSEQQPWAAATAARGIALLGGEDEARRVWLDLMDRPQPEMVANAVRAVEDVYYVPTLIALLRRRQESGVRRPALRVLGRLKDPAAFPPLVDCLAVPDLRADAVEALGDLGDLRAIPYLEPLLEDATEVGEEDKFGPMLTVSDLARRAITQLRTPANRAATASAAVSPLQQGRPGPAITMSPPPPLHTITAPPPRLHVDAFFPLALAILGVPWVIAVFIISSALTGQLTNDRIKKFQDAICMVPAITGLLMAITVVARGRARRLLEITCVALGVLACGLFVYAFGSELMNG